MNSFQDHGGNDIFIEEAGPCAAGTPVKTFSYPGIERRICFQDKSYRQVKHLPATATKWFKNNNNLAGTSVVGVEGNIFLEW